MPIPDFIVELRAKVGHTPLWLIGATAVVTRTVADSQQVLLVKRADSGRWAPVSGIVDPGEDPHVAAVREIREETGYDAEVDRLLGIDTMVIPAEKRHTANAPLYAMRVIYRAHVTGGELRNEVGGSSDEARWVRLDEVSTLKRVSLLDLALRLESEEPADGAVR